MTRWKTSLKWLYPRMRVKRWIALTFVGLLIFLVGMGILGEGRGPDSPPLAIRISNWILQSVHSSMRPSMLGLLLAGSGTLLCLFALGKLIHSLTSVLAPEMAPGGLVDVVYQRRKLTHGRRIVVVGGGTGLSTMLRGLKQYTANITAVVTVADDGGSSGRIQKQLNILPPGDIRNCLVALADAEPQMTELFQYRFRNSVQPPPRPTEAVVPRRETVSALTSKAQEHHEAPAIAPALPAPAANGSGFGEGLRDHAFGNLLIAAMCAINGGDFERAVQETSRVLNIRGRVLPSTVTHVHLRGEMEDGSFIDGETNIAHSPLKIKRISLVPPDACPIEDVLEALENADLIVLGPGSVFTSVIPNLLVQGVSEAIRRSKAKKVYVCNVMTQPGETDGFSAFGHIQAIERHARQRVFDHVLVNTGRPSQELLTKYRQVGSLLVEPDIDRIKAEGYHPIPGNYINQTDVVRHNAGLLAEAIMRLLD